MKMQRDMHKKNIYELNSELLSLLREKFNLKMQSNNRELRKPHLLKQVRRNIARINTLLKQHGKS